MLASAFVGTARAKSGGNSLVVPGGAVTANTNLRLPCRTLDGGAMAYLPALANEFPQAE